MNLNKDVAYDLMEYRSSVANNLPSFKEFYENCLLSIEKIVVFFIVILMFCVYVDIYITFCAIVLTLLTLFLFVQEKCVRKLRAQDLNIKNRLILLLFKFYKTYHKVLLKKILNELSEKDKKEILSLTSQIKLTDENSGYLFYPLLKLEVIKKMKDNAIYQIIGGKIKGFEEIIFVDKLSKINDDNIKEKKWFFFMNMGSDSCIVFWHEKAPEYVDLLKEIVVFEINKGNREKILKVLEQIKREIDLRKNMEVLVSKKKNESDRVRKKL